MAKFVPLYSKEGKEADVVRLAGRHECECQAVKHGLVSQLPGLRADRVRPGGLRALPLLWHLGRHQLGLVNCSRYLHL